MFATSTSTTIYGTRINKLFLTSVINFSRNNSPLDLDRRLRSRDDDRRRSSPPLRLPPGGPPRRVEPSPPPTQVHLSTIQYKRYKQL